MTPERRIGEAELHAYLDGELAAEECAEMEALLAASPVELALLRDFRDLNEAIVQRYASRLDAPVPERMKQVLAGIPKRVARHASHSARPVIEGLRRGV